MITTTIRKKLLTIIFTGILASLGTLTMNLKPKPSFGAERISFSLPVLGEFYISVNSLELYAREGTITPELEFYTKRLKPETVKRLRQALQKQFDVNPTDVYRMTNIPMGKRVLRQLGEVVSTHRERNGLYAIRSALILAAADSEGLNLINFLRYFPTQEIRLNAKSIFSLLNEAKNFFTYKQSTVEAIAEQARREAVAQSEVDFEQMPNLLETGSYAVERKTMTLAIERVRQTRLGLSLDYRLQTDIYLPQNLRQPAPLVVISHGFTSGRSNFDYLAKHLASHGYIIVVPEHIGSNSKFTEAVLRGELSVDVSPFEYYSRPLDITLLLNQIENQAEFQGLINWSQVGILGHSFGGNTALVMSGAPLNLARISQVCQQNKLTLNTSILLQCRASHLPPGEYNHSDPRIKAVAVVNPVTSSILGPESMSKIAIPTMILGGSEDIITPFIEEQAHPFLWLTTKHKYLGVMVGGSHNSSSSARGVANLPKLLKGVRPDLGRSYLKAMSLAFFEVHLRERVSSERPEPIDRGTPVTADSVVLRRSNGDYQSYLSAAYAQTISTEKLPFYLIKSLTPEQLAQAYGKTPPTPPIPGPVVAVAPSKNANILAEIKQTKALKIAMRSDAPPFGYIDTQGNLWTGYCEDLADSLGGYLAQKLNIASGIEVIKLPSSLENRFELVRQNAVHLECGPNTIRTDLEDVSFSDLFFASGTRFLLTKNKAAKVNLEGSLEGIKTGVLPGSTTEQFLQATYPQTELVYFEGAKGRSAGVKAIADGSIDAFVSDGVLLSGEIDRQNLVRDNYQLIPEQPLTCDFYGLILPQGDSQWRDTVNTFLRTVQQRQKRVEWFGDYFPQALSDADYCLNRRR